MDLVLKLRELRRMRGLSQKELARLSGVGEKTLSSFETGERIGSLKLSQLRTLLRFYGITEEEFFSFRLEQMLDPESTFERTRAQALVAGIEKLPPAMREVLLERFELMLLAAQLAFATHPRNAPIPPVAQTRPSFQTHAASAA